MKEIGQKINMYFLIWSVSGQHYYWVPKNLNLWIWPYCEQHLAHKKGFVLFFFSELRGINSQLQVIKSELHDIQSQLRFINSKCGGNKLLNASDCFKREMLSIYADLGSVFSEILCVLSVEWILIRLMRFTEYNEKW